MSNGADFFPKKLIDELNDLDRLWRGIRTATDLHPVPVLPVSSEPLDLTTETLKRTDPIEDIPYLALHVAQLTMVVAMLLDRIEALENSHAGNRHSSG